MNRLKIVSGGQTGVDQAALDAAIASGIACGGWCPQGRLAENGTIPTHYPVTELEGAGYPERTRQNIIDSDATAIIYFDTLSGGSEKTLLYCIQLKKPYLLIDATELTSCRAAERMHSFIREKSIAVLNIAGPRASCELGAYSYTFKAVSLVPTLLRENAYRP